MCVFCALIGFSILKSLHLLCGVLRTLPTTCRSSQWVHSEIRILILIPILILSVDASQYETFENV